MSSKEEKYRRKSGSMKKESKSAGFSSDDESIEQVFQAPRDIGGSVVIRRFGVNTISRTGQKVEPLIDSRELLLEEDYKRLWENYEKYGYVLLKNVLDRKKIFQIKDSILKKLKSNGMVDANGVILNGNKGKTIARGENIVISGDSASGTVTDFRDLSSFVRNNELLDELVKDQVIKYTLRMLSYGRSMREKVKMAPLIINPQYSWLRLKGKDEFTGEHADIFYLMQQTDMLSNPNKDEKKTQTHEIICCVCKKTGENTQEFLTCNECFNICHKKCAKAEAGGRKAIAELSKQVFDFFPNSKVRKSLNLEHCLNCDPAPLIGTCWIPLGDIALDDGVLAFMPGSKDLPKFEMYDIKNEHQLPKSFWTKEHSENMVWHTGSFSAGDLMVFDSKLIHCSSKNYSDKYRMSLDFRWYMAPDRPKHNKSQIYQHVKSRSTVVVTSDDQPRKPIFPDNAIHPNDHFSKIKSEFRNVVKAEKTSNQMSMVSDEEESGIEEVYTNLKANKQMKGLIKQGVAALSGTSSNSSNCLTLNKREDFIKVKLIKPSPNVKSLLEVKRASGSSKEQVEVGNSSAAVASTSSDKRKIGVFEDVGGIIGGNESGIIKKRILTVVKRKDILG